ncbi:MAG: succinylglutamate desuccinylase/aspartoacylase family protein [Amaricoccus sp.]
MPEPNDLPGRRETIALPQIASGTRREVTVLRFGAAGARPKAYLQAGLHADELPGMLVLARLARLLSEAEGRGEIRGEVVLVPVANPIGLAQQVQGHLRGRYEANSSGNFNRGYADLAPPVAGAVAGRLGGDAAANVAAIRAAMGEVLAEAEARDEIGCLRLALLRLACDADFVLDLHADNEAVLHLYTGTTLWPGAADLAAELGARAVLLAEVSGGNPFDEACSGPWWALARQFPAAAIPPACLAVTVELRSNNDVDAGLAAADAGALLRFLMRRGVVAGDPGPLPAPACDATRLDAMQQVRAFSAGIVVYRAGLGDVVAAGDTVAEIVDPLGGTVPVLARTSGVLFARHDQPLAWPGKVIGKIAGHEPLPERRGALLTD